MTSYQHVLAAALALSYDDRAMLEEALDETLHPPGGYTEDELEAIVVKRCAELDAGTATTMDMATFDAALRAIAKRPASP